MLKTVTSLNAITKAIALSIALIAFGTGCQVKSSMKAAAEGAAKTDDTVVVGPTALPAILYFAETTTLDFGTKAVGASTAGTAFFIANVGGADATAIDRNFTGNFAILGGTWPGTGGTCTTTLTKSSACYFVVSFTPTASGIRTGTVVISYNDGTAAQSITRNLTGTGSSLASFSVSDGAVYDYGSVLSGATASKTFTVTNDGGATGTFSALPSFGTAQYTRTGGTCSNGGTLAAAATCTVITTFNPSTTGTLADTLTISYNDSSAAQTATRAVTGVGYTLGALVISDAATYDYGTLTIGNTSDKTFTVSKTGSNSATSVSETTLAAPYAFKGGSFPGTGGTCTTTITADCTVVVTYTPTSAVTSNGTLTLSYSNGAATVTAARAITGTGQTAGTLVISDAATYDYGTKTIGTATDKTFTITKSGTASATSVSETTLAAPYAFKGGSFPGTGGTCTTTISANCTVVVTYTPTAAVTSNGTLTLSYNTGAATTTAARAITGAGQTVGVLVISDAATYDYGTKTIGTATDKTFTITKSGSADATSVSETTLAAPYAFKGGSFPGTGGTCTTTISANCTVVVTYSPTAAVTSNGTLTLAYNDGAANVTAARAITGVGQTAGVLVISDAATYDYGTKTIGTATDKTFTVTKTGTDSATSVSETTLAAPYAFKGGSFPGTGGSCTTTITADCTVVVTYSPTAAVTSNGTLTLSYSNGATTVTAARAITGTGQTVGVLVISDGATYTYPDTNVSSTADKTFTVAKTGTDSATSITETTLAAPFAFKGGSFPGTGGTCTTTITADCTVVVTYSPTAAVTSNGTLTLAYSNGASNTTAARAITGTGLAVGVSDLAISDGATFNFTSTTVGNSTDKSFTITNNGGATATGMSGNAFSVTDFIFKGGSYPGTGGTCDTTLAAAATCTVVTQFVPQSSGAKSSTLSIAYNNGPATRAVTGTGLTPASLAIGTGTFTNTTVGATYDVTYTVTNSGGSTATISATPSENSAHYSVTGGTCTNASTVAAAATCTVILTFAPTTSGTLTGTLTVTYNNAVSAGQTATRAFTAVALTPASIAMVQTTAFPKYYLVHTQSAGASMTVTLTNSGGSQATGLGANSLGTGINYTGGTYPGTSGTCSTTLNAAATCTLKMTYTPEAVPTLIAADVTLDYNDGAAAQTTTTTYSGYVMAPQTHGMYAHDFDASGGVKDLYASSTIVGHQRCTNDGAGAFTCATADNHANVGFNFTMIDETKDGILDLIFPSAAGFSGSPASLLRDALTGSHSYSSTATTFALDTPRAVVDIAQFSSLDRGVSIAIPANDAIYMNASGDYTSALQSFTHTYSGTPTKFIISGDIDGDTYTDLLYSPATDQECTIYALTGDLGGGFSEYANDFSATFGTNDCKLMGAAMADFNSDGINDIAIISYANKGVLFAHGNGGGRFTASSQLNTAAAGLTSIVVTDTNADGCMDILVGNFTTRTIERSVNTLDHAVCGASGWGAFSTRATGARSVIGLTVGNFRGNAGDWAVLMQNGTTSGTMAPVSYPYNQ